MLRNAVTRSEAADMVHSVDYESSHSASMDVTAALSVTITHEHLGRRNVLDALGRLWAGRSVCPWDKVCMYRRTV